MKAAILFAPLFFFASHAHAAGFFAPAEHSKSAGIDQPASELPSTPSHGDDSSSKGLLDGWFSSEKSRSRASSYATGPDGKTTGDFLTSFVVMPAAESIAGELGLSYFWNPYIYYNFSAFYNQRESGERHRVNYGPNVDLMARFINTTNLTPYAGIGFGLEKWHLYSDTESFDDEASASYSSVIGIRAGLTRNFGVQVANRWVTYLGGRPLKFAKDAGRDERTQGRASVGFYLAM